MNPDFGERQYEFAVNYELTQALSALLVAGAPIIPTTSEEAKLGWDAMFNLGSGYLYHLQYKVATYGFHQTPTNKHYLTHHGGAYYRFALLADAHGVCRQHLTLEKLRKCEPGVYYCAPTFHSGSDFWAHVASKSVFEHSALIDIDHVSLPTPSAPHAVSYDLSGNVQVWSEEGEGRYGDRSPQIRRQLPVRDISPRTFRGLLLDFVETLASDASMVHRVPQLTGSGIRTSIVAARMPRTAQERFSGRTAPRRGTEAREAFEQTRPVRDRDEAVELVEALSDQDVLTTVGRISALDFGLTTVVEPA